MKSYWWTLAAVGLLALALTLRFGFMIQYPAYALGFVAMGMVFWQLRDNWVALCAILVGGALILIFALRGYDWWGYAAVFAAALIALHHFLPTPWWRAVLALTCLGLIYFCIVETPIIKNARTDREPERDYLIVLGAAVHGDEPSLTLIRRCEGALDYLTTYPDSIAIVTGGQGPDENLSEAQAMYDWLVARGIAPERVIREPQATSTMENLRYSFDIIRSRGDEPDGKVAIVSSAYHLYRAKLMAKSLGVEAAGVAAPWGYFFVMLNYFIREAFGVTHLWVFGR